MAFDHLADCLIMLPLAVDWLRLNALLGILSLNDDIGEWPFRPTGVSNTEKEKKEMASSNASQNHRQ